MNNITFSNKLTMAIAIGFIGITTPVYAQQAPPFDPFQIGGVQQPTIHSEYDAVQDWADTYKKNVLVAINKEVITLYANIPISSIMAKSSEIVTMAGITTAMLAVLITILPDDYARKTIGNRSFFFRYDGYPDWESVTLTLILPTLWLGLVLLRLPEWQRTATTIQELWSLATRKTPLLSFWPQGMVVGNKTKIKWSEIDSATKIQEQIMQPDGTIATTLHLAVHNRQGMCLTKIPGIVLPTSIDAVLELISYYQQENGA